MSGDANSLASMKHFEVSKAAQKFLSKKRQHLIGDQWVDSASGETFEVYNPANGEVIAHAAAGNKEDIDRAVKAAKKSFTSGPWLKMRPAEREKVIRRIGDLLLENIDEMAELESIDNGKPVVVAKAMDVAFSAELFHYYAGWPTKIEGTTVPVSSPFTPGMSYHAYTRREPVGVVGQIIPWNFPLLMAAFKLAPVLATGCSVVLKPAEETPLTALRLGELMLEAGLPPGVINIITGFGETTGAPLVAHPDVVKVAFTGSTEVGRLIVKAAAGNLKKVTLELGGKSPNIICEDADLSLAIPGAANAIFFNQGQVCTAGSRLFVHEKIFDKVVQGVADVAKGLKVGPGLDPNTQIGPLVSATQLGRVSGYLKSGADEGAKALSGGKPSGGKGYFVEPTVLVNTRPDMKVVKEEIFGPVVTAIPFKEVNDELIAKANDTIYGLAAGLWSQDVGTVHRVASQLQAGTVWVNCYNAFDASMPFGGFKQSGWGRELGHTALDNYLETKSVCVAYRESHK